MNVPTTLCRLWEASTLRIASADLGTNPPMEEVKWGWLALSVLPIPFASVENWTLAE
jgi:hypothetical protein